MLRTQVLTFPIDRLRRRQDHPRNRQFSRCDYFKQQSRTDHIRGHELAVVGYIILVRRLVRDDIDSLQCAFPCRPVDYVTPNEFHLFEKVFWYATGVNPWVERVHDPYRPAFFQKTICDMGTDKPCATGY